MNANKLIKIEHIFDFDTNELIVYSISMLLQYFWINNRDKVSLNHFICKNAS